MEGSEVMSLDPAIIERYAKLMELKAGSRVARFTAFGIALGALVGALPLLAGTIHLVHSAIPAKFGYALAIAGAAGGGYLGYLVGQSRAVALRLQAHVAVHQLEVERLIRRLDGLQLPLPRPDAAVLAPEAPVEQVEAPEPAPVLPAPVPAAVAPLPPLPSAPEPAPVPWVAPVPPPLSEPVPAPAFHVPTAPFSVPPASAPPAPPAPAPEPSPRPVPVAPSAPVPFTVPVSEPLPSPPVPLSAPVPVPTLVPDPPVLAPEPPALVTPPAARVAPARPFEWATPPADAVRTNP
jgi:hypothetical protein